MILGFEIFYTELKRGPLFVLCTLKVKVIGISFAFFVGFSLLVYSVLQVLKMIVKKMVMVVQFCNCLKSPLTKCKTIRIIKQKIHRQYLQKN